eukprot:2241641-Rhodomonas_salina.1
MEDGGSEERRASQSSPEDRRWKAKSRKRRVETGEPDRRQWSEGAHRAGGGRRWEGGQGRARTWEGGGGQGGGLYSVCPTHRSKAAKTLLILGGAQTLSPPGSALQIRGRCWCAIGWSRGARAEAEGGAIG